MMINGSDTFYSDLTGFPDFKEFCNPSCYMPLPDDWLVVISDVQGSTQAIKAGRYKQANALGAASIIALLNAVHPIQVPCVFGGDGAKRAVKEKENRFRLAAEDPAVPG